METKSNFAKEMNDAQMSPQLQSTLQQTDHSNQTKSSLTE